MRSQRNKPKTDLFAWIHTRYVPWSVNDTLARIVWVLMLPVILVRGLFRLGIAISIGMVRGAIRLFFSLLGLAFLGWVGFAMIRVIFHPLFK